MRRVDGASAAVFRIGFGVAALVLVLRFVWHGWIDSIYVAPQVHFPYWGMTWIAPWPGPLMHLHFALMGAAAACIAFGWRYRLSTAAFFVLFTYVELIDRTQYLNHYYWMSVTSGLMCLLPLHGTWSLDAARRRWGLDGTVPAWTVWALRFQVGIVYAFAGVAKLSRDWLLDGQPLRIWLGARSDLPLVGPLLREPDVAVALAWISAVFDLTIVGWLLWRHSRRFAYAAVVLFHAATWVLFPSIGVFPLIMAVGALVFFDPSWPRTLIGRRPRRPVQGRVMPRRSTAAALAVVAALQLAIPMRHLLYPSDVDWSGEGYAFSWRVLLTERAGSVDFVVTDPATGSSWFEDVSVLLTERQMSMVATDAVLIQQTAGLIADEWALRGRPGVEVHVDAYLSVNGGPVARYVDPAVDLAAAPHGLAARSWIEPRP